MKPKLSVLALITYLVFLAFVLLTPNDGKTQNNLLWFLNLSKTWQNFLNFLLLMPLPILIKWVNPKIKISELILIGSALSAFVEMFQNRIPGRVSDWLDFCLNSAGILVTATFFKVKKSLVD